MADRSIAVESLRAMAQSLAAQALRPIVGQQIIQNGPGTALRITVTADRNARGPMIGQSISVSNAGSVILANGAQAINDLADAVEAGEHKSRVDGILKKVLSVGLDATVVAAVNAVMATLGS